MQLVMPLLVLRPGTSRTIAAEPCRVCRKTPWEAGNPLQRCQGCHTAVYCSRACQRVDWPARHRVECKEAIRQIERRDFAAAHIQFRFRAPRRAAALRIQRRWRLRADNRLDEAYANWRPDGTFDGEDVIEEDD